MKKAVKLSLNKGVIDLSHGAGGQAMTQLIQQLFIDNFANEYLTPMHDYAQLPWHGDNVVMATDSYVVSPLFFPGGNIGDLAINGTLNDVAMSGAVAQFISVGFIIEEGFAVADLNKIVKTMANLCQQHQVNIVTGDTKVVEKNAADGIFINTTAIGLCQQKNRLSHAPKPGDKIIINGDIGDHGVAILSSRENISFGTAIKSDTAALCGLIKQVMQNVNQKGEGIAMMRDPTRGGIAAVLNEWASHYQCAIKINEAQLPVKPAVKSACELLGLDYLYLANEGKVLLCCDEREVESVLATMHQHPFGRQACVIGEVIEQQSPVVLMQTGIGGLRLVDWLIGEQYPRIC